MKPLHPRELEYSVTATWDGLTGGAADAGGFRLGFDTPPEYGGRGSAPCPDQLFLAALGGCILNTFASFRGRLGAEAAGASVDASCSVELSREGYRVTGVSAVMRVVSAPSMERLNRRCAELAFENCHLTRSIEAAIPVSFAVEVEVAQP